MKSIRLVPAALIMFCSIVTAQVKSDSAATKIVFRDAKNTFGEPLFILDNQPVNKKDFDKIDPNTIESITILKDSGAIAIYGRNGKNGVIIIKTKKRSKRELRKMKKED